MKRTIRIVLVACSLASLDVAYGLRLPEAGAQRAHTEPQWEYKVAIFSYNPGERLSDQERRALLERTLNDKYSAGNPSDDHPANGAAGLPPWPPFKGGAGFRLRGLDRL